MSTKKNNRNNNKAALTYKSEQQPLSFWIMIGMTIWFLFYAPFSTGLFNGYQPSFDGPIYCAAILSSVILSILAIHFFWKWEAIDLRHILGILIWLLPLIYWISSIQAVSPHLAKNAAFIHMMYAIFFLAGLFLANKHVGLKIIVHTLTITGYAMVLFGIANMFGNMYSRDAVMLTDQGYRITSDFQYANTYAAFLMLVLLCCLYHITHTAKRYWIAAHSLMLVPICLSFWLTLSRGGLVTLPFIFLLILPLLSLGRQLAFFIYTGLGISAIIPIADGLSQRSTNLVQKVWNTIDVNAPFPEKTVQTIGWFDKESLIAWLIVILATVLLATLIYTLQNYALPFFEKKLNYYSSTRRSRFVIPGIIIAMILIGAITIFTGIKNIFPAPIQEQMARINFQQHSFLERAAIYKDSLKVIRDYPILGTGGGGWATIYEKYQGNPYTARQAHNFLLQYTVEVGSIGLIIVVLLIFTVLILYLRKFFKTMQNTEHMIFYFIIISLTVHSLLDFDISYVYIASLIFLSLGGLASTADFRPNWIAKVENNHWFRWGYPTALSILATFVFFSSIIMYSANKSYTSATNGLFTQKPVQEIIEDLDKAIDKQPRNPDYLVKKADIFMQLFMQTKEEQYYNQSFELLKDIRRYEPNNRLATDFSVQAYLQKNKLSEAIDLLEEALSRYPWEINYYNQLSSLLFQSWNQARMAGQTTEMGIYASKLQTVYNTVTSKTDELKYLPEGQLQGRAFSVTPSIRLSFGQYHYLKGDAAKTAELLEQTAKESTFEGDEQDVTIQKYIVRWYLAALQKIGKQDQEMKTKLLSKWPDEANEINKLVQ